MWYLVTLCHRDGEYSKLVFPNSWNLSCVCVHTCVCMSWGLVGRVAERNCKQWNKLRPATKGPVVHFNIEEFGLYGDMEEFHYGSYWHSTKIILERFSYRDREGGGKIGEQSRSFCGWWGERWWCFNKEGAVRTRGVRILTNDVGCGINRWKAGEEEGKGWGSGVWLEQLDVEWSCSPAQEGQGENT